MKGIFKKAVEQNKITINFIDIRDFSENKHSKVDDYKCGPGPGMVLKVDVLDRALSSISNLDDYEIIYTCPKGEVLNQALSNKLVLTKGLVIICGYYEGIDERIFSLYPIKRVSIGNFILSSGDLASLIICETVIRLIPGIIGKERSVQEDSIINGLLEQPVYTLPREYRGQIVDPIHTSGNHAQYEKWCRYESLKTTLVTQPKLLLNVNLDKNDKMMLTEIVKEIKNGTSTNN